MNIRSEKLVLSSGVFIFTLVVLDSILSNETEKVPREAIGALVLVFMLSSLQFVGLGTIAGPFAALIAGTVFLTRGDRIYTKLSELSQTTETTGGSEIYGAPNYPPGGAPHT